MAKKKKSIDVTKIQFNIKRHITQYERETLLAVLKEQFGIRSVMVTYTKLTLTEPKLEYDQFESVDIYDVDRSIKEEKSMEYFTKFKIKAPLKKLGKQ